MASMLDDSIVHAESNSDDEYTIEYYDYEIVDGKKVGEDEQTELDNKRMASVSVETVEEETDDDEYTYEEEILEVVMEEKVDDMNSAGEPPSLSRDRANGPVSSPSPLTLKPPPPSNPLPNKVPISPVPENPPIAPSYGLQQAPILSSPPIAPSYGLKQPPVYPSPPVAPNLLTPSQQPSYGLKQAPVLMTPSKQRAMAANSAGLSELSKQLRILQAKNESQNVDINRLERQLRILSDLQGISVDGLRKALEDACASEAFEELQNRVSKLKYELEAATLAKRAEMRKDAAAPHIANLELRVGELEEVEEKQMTEIRNLYNALRQERARSTRLESENQQLKGALQNMIHRVQSETARAAQAEASFQKQLQDLRERQAKKMQEGIERSRSDLSEDGKPVQKGTGNFISPEMAAEYEQMVQLLKRKDEELRNLQAKLHADEIRRAENLKEAEERSRQVQMDMQVKADKLALTVKELEDADGQNGLRLAQFKARFAVQDERIVDMGQQLDSLYTAFDLLKEEFDSENNRHAAMLSNLNDADAEIARRTKRREENKDKNRRRSAHGFPPSTMTVDSRSTDASVFTRNIEASVPRYINTSPVAATRRPPIATVAPASPATPVITRANQSMTPRSNQTPDRSYDLNITPYSTNTADRGYSNYAINETYDVYGNETPTTYATARAVHPTPERTASTWELLLNQENRSPKNRRSRIEDYFDQVEGQLIYGNLIVESHSMLRKWKTRPSRIYLRGEGYQWDIGEKRSFPLQFGVSKVDFDPNYPLSFAVSLDPGSPNSPTIRAAAVNEYDYHRWMTALVKATTGEEYQGGAVPDVQETEPTPTYPMEESLDHNTYHGSSNTTRRPHLSRPESSRSLPSNSREEEQDEDAEFKRILELSKYET